MSEPAPRRLVLGAMTGTSLDGLDLALAEVRGRGLGMQARFLRGRSVSLGALSNRLRAAADQAPLPARAFAELALDLGRLHASEMAALAGGDAIDLAVVHGQTIVHAPPVSWQLMNPFPVAASLRCPVLSDLRQADLAAGGQGAPITPLADWVLFRAPHRRAILNLGGFANATALPPMAGPSTRGDGARGDAARGDGARGDATDASLIDSIRGADLCACNHLLDRAARRALGAPFDADGATALSGRADRERLEVLAAALDRQRTGGRSLGTGDELAAAVDDACAALEPAHALATVVGAVAASTARGLRALDAGAEELIVAGGGARNRALLAALERSFGRPVRTSDALGVPIEFREAMEMAVLGALAVDGVPISLRAVTGRGAKTTSDGLRCVPAGLPDAPR